MALTYSFREPYVIRSIVLKEHPKRVQDIVYNEVVLQSWVIDDGCGIDNLLNWSLSQQWAEIWIAANRWNYKLLEKRCKKNWKRTKDNRFVEYI